ncbi:MAG: D-tyrosyl-tRNA(Tyr) deacylase [Lachnospiraceae bacterium]|nr:D-tyrosyl-tRNA(Tyr) deacylase [Lachnospiraceae bacterium]
MKAVIQRVSHAAVTVDGRTEGSIGRGFLILFGVTHGDTEAQAEKLAKKICGLRIFPDENGKTNLSLKDVGGELLVISQFTLYADCHKGYRPSFIQAAEPGEANRLYEYFTGLCRQEIEKVDTGVFGAHMKVELENDGPFTLVLEELPG